MAFFYLAQNKALEKINRLTQIFLQESSRQATKYLCFKAKFTQQHISVSFKTRVTNINHLF